MNKETWAKISPKDQKDNRSYKRTIYKETGSTLE